MRYLLFALTIVVLMAGTACKPRHGGAALPDSPKVETPLPEPEPRMFEQAIFFRPEEGSAGGIVEQMAPLIIVESNEKEISAALSDGLGVGTPGCVSDAEETPIPVVLFKKQSVKIRGESYEQLRYVWHSCVPKPTFFEFWVIIGKNGWPIVYSASPRPFHKGHFYVSTSLEVAAEREFDSPLPYCRFAIERPSGDLLNRRVDRIIDDGPMPLGPYVYIGKSTQFEMKLAGAPPQEVVALTCRCEKSLAKSFLAEPRYKLEQLDQFSDRIEGECLQWKSQPSSVRWCQPAGVCDLCAWIECLNFENDLGELFRWPTNMPK